MGKTGAKAAPAPLSEGILGTGPRIVQERAPPLEDELSRIAEEQVAWKAKGGKVPGSL